MQLSVKEPFYRKASSDAPEEDGRAVNLPAKMFVVSDGVSGPYSPSNPGMKYSGGITGGQMVSKTICAHVSSALPDTDICGKLLETNKAVFANHLVMGKDPAKEAVAGASVAACQVCAKEVLTVLIGDCFVLYEGNNGFHFLTNFDQAAFDFEERGNEAFAQCLQQAGGHKGKAWDLYFGYFSEKQFFRANKNIGQGGHAVLNGSPALLDCWTVKTISLSGLKWMLVGTDGLLTANSMNPKNRGSLEQQIGRMYVAGGILAIVAWRDKEDFLPHIAGNPEASAVELKFG